jgi:hypothetical protein
VLQFANFEAAVKLSSGSDAALTAVSILRCRAAHFCAAAAHRKACLLLMQIRKHNLRGRSSKRSYSSMAAGLE